MSQWIGRRSPYSTEIYGQGRRRLNGNYLERDEELQTLYFIMKLEMFKVDSFSDLRSEDNTNNGFITRLGDFHWYLFIFDNPYILLLGVSGVSFLVSGVSQMNTILLKESLYFLIGGEWGESGESKFNSL